MPESGFHQKASLHTESMVCILRLLIPTAFKDQEVAFET